MAREAMEYDVVIVGAGPAGLTTAIKLKQLDQNLSVCILEKGESLSLCNTLPSHYTFTHYIEGTSPDVFYHPARSLLEVFNPGLDEWSSAVSLYTNEGDVIVHPSYLDYLTPPVDSKRITFTTLVELALK